MSTINMKKSTRTGDPRSAVAATPQRGGLRSQGNAGLVNKDALDQVLKSARKVRPTPTKSGGGSTGGAGGSAGGGGPPGNSPPGSSDTSSSSNTASSRSSSSDTSSGFGSEDGQHSVHFPVPTPGASEDDAPESEHESGQHSVHNEQPARVSPRTPSPPRSRRASLSLAQSSPRSDGPPTSQRSHGSNRLLGSRVSGSPRVSPWSLRTPGLSQSPRSQASSKSYRTARSYISSSSYRTADTHRSASGGSERGFGDHSAGLPGRGPSCVPGDDPGDDPSSDGDDDGNSDYSSQNDGQISPALSPPTRPTRLTSFLLRPIFWIISIPHIVILHILRFVNSFVANIPQFYRELLIAIWRPFHPDPHPLNNYPVYRQNYAPSVYPGMWMLSTLLSVNSFALLACQPQNATQHLLLPVTFLRYLGLAPVWDSLATFLFYLLVFIGFYDIYRGFRRFRLHWKVDGFPDFEIVYDLIIQPILFLALPTWYANALPSAVLVDGGGAAYAFVASSALHLLFWVYIAVTRTWRSHRRPKFIVVMSFAFWLWQRYGEQRHQHQASAHK